MTNKSIPAPIDYLVFSHLRWNFVFQRPQHLMTRCGKANRAFFWEEPIYGTECAHVEIQEKSPGLHVAVPRLPDGISKEESCAIQQVLLAKLMRERGIWNPVLWYYTPMACEFTRLVRAAAVVYDCMDELSAFRGAPPGMRAAEQHLFTIADLVFTGGQSLYESKRRAHPSVHCFPSSIDREFFASARRLQKEPEDQQPIPRPRLGYCGVIDERMDLDLLSAIAKARPEWQIVILGPVAKISNSDLPRAANIHYLGMRDYHSLPAYFSGWDVGLLPFAGNEATRFISPTKTPEYLAAGLPVVSTSIHDVVTPYGTQGLVEIADEPDQFVAAAERAMAERNSASRLKKTDKFLSFMSWDSTWARMTTLITQAVAQNSKRPTATVPGGRVTDCFAAD
ncbi:MAG: glycosyltransferase [Acidobacteria bacterium]|nr:glycosyltransferase [Acidobacteriota bacterium]